MTKVSHTVTGPGGDTTMQPRAQLALVRDDQTANDTVCHYRRPDHLEQLMITALAEIQAIGEDRGGGELAGLADAIRDAAMFKTLWDVTNPPARTRPRHLRAVQ